jgi:hypothetical protein
VAEDAPQEERIAIRVITDELLRVPKLYLYKLEVMSPDSP